MNCKIGDMAIVVFGGLGPQTPGIVGCVVEIIRQVEPCEYFTSVCGNQMRRKSSIPAWLVRSSRPLPWLVSRGPNSGEIFYFTERPIADQNLRPVSGLPVIDEVTEKLKEPA
ncbi:hypothetical protein [Paraburkholderia nemoris]|uniref:hypothetical protein n=1 Tax=Paraburkholderia nemoris TaxID=2793076 RepID=UPI001B8C7E81|nr:hypothetical protein [Paraburkholderia nemoris]